MRRNKTKKTKLVVVLLVLVLLMSVGYAALTTNLTINGTATIKKKSWSVYFNNVQVKTGSVTADTTPTTSGTETTELTWEVSMDTPGQFYEFNVDVVNGGTIDAMVSIETNDIVTSALSTEQKKYLDYTITYVNGVAIEQYDKLAAGETKTLTVKLLFKQDINAEDLPSTAQDGITFSYTTNYVQADDNAVEKVTGPIRIGDKVNYSTTLNGQTLDNWKLFYVDGDYTYIILDDYLPNAAVNTDDLNGISTNDNYSVYAQNNRTELLNAMTTKSNWSSLLSGTINGHEVNETSNANAWAMGAPTLDLWVNSWNETYPNDKLYTSYSADVDGSGYDGWYVGIEPDWDSCLVYLMGTTGYDNTLYFPHQERVESIDSYWLASPAGNDDNYVMCVSYNGSLESSSYDWPNLTLRPVVCLPSSVVNQ